VLGGGVVVMFGMVAAAGLNMLAEVEMTSRNMVIIAIALSIGLGLNAEPEALQHLDDTLRILLTSGILPVAFIAVFLNALLPDERKD
jgi:xanthine/uracil permease